MHGLPGSPFGPTGFANCEVDPAGAQGYQTDSLSVVYWWLAVIVKKSGSCELYEHCYRFCFIATIPVTIQLLLTNGQKVLFICALFKVMVLVVQRYLGM